MMQQSQTNIEKFREEMMENSNIVTFDTPKTILSAHQDFSENNLNKPYSEIQFDQVLETIDDSKITGKWTQKVMKGSKQMKGSSNTKFTSYEMKVGDVLSIGSNCNQKNNLLLLTDVQSTFCSHSFAFGDDNQQKLLTTPISEISGDNPDFRKLSKINLDFNICSQTQQYQLPQTMEQLKYLSLIHQITCRQVGQVHDAKGQSTQEFAGFIKQAFDNRSSEEITKMQFQFQLFQLNSWSEPVQIIKINDPNGKFSVSDSANDSDTSSNIGGDSVKSSISIEQMNSQYKTVSQAMKALQFKNLDLIVRLDSCLVQKEGKKLSIKPKMEIVSIIIKDENGSSGKSQKTYGINTQKWFK